MARDKNKDTVDTGNPELGTPAGVEQVKPLGEAREAARTGEGDTTVNTVEDAYEKGYFGTSPAREATGRDDKGLSQASPEVMERTGFRTAEMPEPGEGALTEPADENRDQADRS